MIFSTCRFTKYLIDNGDGTFTDDTGKKVPFTPSHQVTASAEVHTDLSHDAGRVTIGGDYSYRSSEEFTVSNNTPQFIRDLTEWRGIVNLRASWSSQDERWEVSFWGKNITNRHYAVIAQDFTSAYASFADVVANQDHIFVSQSGPYQSFGVTLRTTFLDGTFRPIVRNASTKLDVNLRNGVDHRPNVSIRTT